MPKIKKIFFTCGGEFLFKISEICPTRKEKWHQILFVIFFFGTPTRLTNPHRDSSTIEYTECCLTNLPNIRLFPKWTYIHRARQHISLQNWSALKHLWSYNVTFTCYRWYNPLQFVKNAEKLKAWSRSVISAQGKLLKISFSQRLMTDQLHRIDC